MLAPFHSQPFRTQPPPAVGAPPHLLCLAAANKVNRCRWAPLQTGAPPQRAPRRRPPATGPSRGRTSASSAPRAQDLQRTARVGVTVHEVAVATPPLASIEPLRRATPTPSPSPPPLRSLRSRLPRPRQSTSKPAARPDRSRAAAGRKKARAAAPSTKHVGHWELERVVGCEQGRNGRTSYWVLWKGGGKPTLQHERDLRLTADIAVAQYHREALRTGGALGRPSHWFRARYGDDDAGWPWPAGVGAAAS
ncbi:hypothetical protein LTR22_027533 [Elasticomyces elasticus]|nr:hypothetical protein LTR22_027533 [Elasticomyces elasticus]